MDWELRGMAIDSNVQDELSKWVSNTKQYTSGPLVSEFEYWWSHWTKRDWAVFVNSGSSANMLMIESVKAVKGIPDGSEVIVPAVAWGTSIAAVIRAGLKPVFVDVNLEDLSFDYDAIDKAVTEKTRLIYPTHLLGFTPNKDELRRIAKHFSLEIIEDCCEAVKDNGELASSFSFYWTHHLTTVEGGMVCTDNVGIRDYCRLLRDHGLDRSGSKFNFLALGYNVRNTEIAAKIGLLGCEKLWENVLVRIRNYHKFVDMLRGIIYHRFLWRELFKDAPFCLPFIFQNKWDAFWVRELLDDLKIEHRSILGGNLLRHNPFQKYDDYQKFYNAEIVSDGFYIGNHEYITEAMVESLCSRILREQETRRKAGK